LQSWQSYYAGRGLPTNTPPSGAPSSQTQITPAPATNARNDTTSRSISNRPETQNQTPASQNRLHTITSGETFGTIARRYRISTAALQSANPTIDARRLRPGQALVIPPP
jgi:LysM repeat protein